MFRITSCILIRIAFLSGLVPITAGAAQPTSSTATYGDWTVRCRYAQEVGNNPSSNNNTSEGKRDGNSEGSICEMAQIIKIQQKGQSPKVIAQIALGSLPAGSGKSRKIKLVLQVPSGVFLRSAVMLSFGKPKSNEASSNKILTASYFRCQSGFCLADTNLSDAELKMFNNAKTAKLHFVDASRRTISFPVSMRGANGAFEAIFTP